MIEGRSITLPRGVLSELMDSLFRYPSERGNTFGVSAAGVLISLGQGVEPRPYFPARAAA
jgi:hypothetical protein